MHPLGKAVVTLGEPVDGLFFFFYVIALRFGFRFRYNLLDLIYSF